MPIKLKCPRCGESYKVADDRAGKSFRCRQCQGPVKVPVDMFVATLDKMEMEMASEMEADGDEVTDNQKSVEEQTADSEEQIIAVSDDIAEAETGDLEKPTPQNSKKS